MKWLLLFVVAISLSRCGGIPCNRAELYFGLIGFSDAESQQIILRQYAKGSSFTSRTDTLIMHISFRRTNDTLEASSFTSGDLLVSQYDYEVVLPLANRTFRITRIDESIHERRRKWFNNTKETCVNGISSLTIDNQVTIPAGFNLFYLKK